MKDIFFLIVDIIIKTKINKNKPNSKENQNRKFLIKEVCLYASLIYPIQVVKIKQEPDQYIIDLLVSNEMTKFEFE